jgi:mono/diheme cytochrome c family protein
MIRIALTILVSLAISCVSASAETLLERGSYLVNAVMGCDGCHTPRTPSTGLALEKRFSGGTVLFDLPAYTVRGSNITPDHETGIGDWSEEDLKRALIDGVRPNGVPLAPSMPFAFYKVLTPRDLDAVVAYVRSVAPIRNEAQIPNYKAEMHTDLVPGGERSIGNEVPTDPVKRGFYLATLAHCMECHARRPDNQQDYKNWWGKGGAEFKGPWGQVIARNISAHKESGVGAWTDDEIKRALTHGVGRDGRAFKLPMARQIYYSKLTAADLDAIVAWVRTIPPME